MTKEDYLKLSKERLAELLVEQDKLLASRPTVIPYTIVQPRQPLCYEKDGVCTNPFHDCVNCPKIHGSGFDFVTTSSWTGDEVKNFQDKEDINGMPDGNPRS